jgi:hypothetical protein
VSICSFVILLLVLVTLLCHNLISSTFKFIAQNKKFVNVYKLVLRFCKSSNLVLFCLRISFIEVFISERIKMNNFLQIATISRQTCARHISTTAACCTSKQLKVTFICYLVTFLYFISQISRFKTTRVTYQEAQKPEHIGVRASWFTWNTCEFFCFVCNRCFNSFQRISPASRKINHICSFRTH